jgi:hypothetical protein
VRGAQAATHWTLLLAALLVGIAIGSALDLLGDVVPPSIDQSALRGDLARSQAASRPDARTARASQADAARIESLTAELDEARAACVRDERERDEAVATSAAPAAQGTSLLALIESTDEKAAVRLGDRLREELVAARRNDVESHWERVIGPGLPCADGKPGTDLLEMATQNRFKRLYAELRRPRTPEEVRRLHDAFAEPYRTRLHELRKRVDQTSRAPSKRDTVPEGPAELRVELWSEGEAVLTILDPLLDEDERNELRVRGSEALGIPPPVERLRLGWTRLLGDDVPPPGDFHVVDEEVPFVYVYCHLQHVRTRDELRTIRSRIQAALEVEGRADCSEFEAVKELLRPDEWRRLRWFSSRGQLPLSR